MIAPLNKKLKSLEKELKNDLENEILKDNINTLKNEIANIKGEYKFKEEIIRDKIESEAKEQIKTLEEYRIFMAIVEEIGFDATGKQTCEYEQCDLAKVAQQFKEYYAQNWGKK
ncbi:hypothetical protein [Helicobacter sp. MIT 14-3879]|uniref:hypothetical protein n=1 Tax=Helicobacter sp. MIT 14-3879 TaxID=2040649 RepID=UPI002163350C|nr:hypothetical protein [Helicobacter sp. MIT 14-3879]